MHGDALPSFPASGGLRLGKLCERLFHSGGNLREGLSMTAYDLFVLSIAGANGGLMCWMLRRREQVMAWITVRARRR